MRTRNYFFYLFLAGMFAGTLYLNLRKSVLLAYTDIWAEDMIRGLSELSLQGSALFVAILYRRGIRFAGISALATTYLGRIVCCLSVLWYGFLIGVYLTSAILRLGFRGILLAVACIFPQGILYGGFLYGLYWWCFQTCSLIYGRGSRENGSAIKNTPVLTERVLSWLFLAGLLLAGCALESYVNPVLLQKIAAKML